MNYTITNSRQFNSIEIAFTEKPAKEIRDALKALRFRWHQVKKVWYGYATEEEIKKILDGSKPAKTEKGNKFGVKVGDVFSASWGYEQTNNDFFQVVELVGTSSVRIVEVHPKYETVWAGGMAEDRKLQEFDGSPLPKNNSSWCIKDQEKGDLHRVLAIGNNIYIKVNESVWAYPTKGGETYYESWYA